MTSPTPITALPPLPTVTEANSERILETLKKLYEQAPLQFDRVFSDPNGAAVPNWHANAADLDILQSAGMLSHVAGRHVPAFLVTPWNGAFYLTDFPDTGFREEVFSPHPEQVLLTRLLQSRNDDHVLDLCTGSGILLLEAARKGASGLGIDISPRAIGLARRNAQINSSLLQGEVEFREGDATEVNKYADWGRPTVIITNPPFEPIPDELDIVRPLHSSAGPLGTDVFEKILKALSGWTHRPKLFQFVLFSLGKIKNPAARDLLMGRLLQDWSMKRKVCVDMQELLAPLPIQDYLAVHLGVGPGDVPEWQRTVDSQGFDSIHLLFGVMRPAGVKERPSVNLSCHDELALEDACFAWPLSSKKRRGLNGSFKDGRMASRAFTNALMDVREKHMEAARVGFSLMGTSARQLLKPMLQQPMLYGPTCPLVVLDLHSDDTKRGLDQWTDHGTLTIQNQQSEYDILRSQGDLRSAVLKIFSSRSAALIVTAWKRVEDGAKQHEPRRQTELLGWEVGVGNTGAMLDACLKKSSDMVQRFVIFSPPETALTPRQQRNCVALLSELVYSHYLGDQRIGNAYNSVGHYLKNNLDILMRLLDDNRRNIRPEIKSLYQFAGMFELIGKLGREPFHSSFLDPKYRKKWPNVVRRREVLADIADVIANRTIYYLQREDYEHDLVIRRIFEGSVANIGPIVAIDDTTTSIPPFAATKECRHADLFLLAGLSEICRNAVLATSDNNRNAIHHEYEGGFRHIDFEVSINEAEASIGVTIWNPFAGMKVTRSTAVEKLSRVYALLERAVELTPAEKSVYLHGCVKKGNERAPLYARSRFLYFPMRLPFHGSHMAEQTTDREVST